jgi:dipeptidyl aminopeptidase/acylaminoacyl peptidase
MSKPLASIAVILAGAVLAAQPHATNGAFPPTVDSIMRGPELVGYPPEGLRWSGDSQRLYFEWRLPGEDVAATWVVGREGGAPRKLSDEERLTAPLPAGQWDSFRRRVLGVDEGDVVIIDAIANRRIEITRSTATESAPRWARNETAVTFVRDNNLFVVPLDTSAGGGTIQLTDVLPRRAESRVTESQLTLRREEADLLDWVEQERARRERRETRTARRALPRFELAERQSVSDAAMSASGDIAYLMVSERAQSRSVNVPRFVSESGYTEDITARTNVGDAQERRRLAVLNLRTGEAFWAGLEGIVDPLAIPRPKLGDTSGDPPSPPTPAPKPAREVRWGTLLMAPDGSAAVVSVRADDNTDRWLVLVDPATGRTLVLDHAHDAAWVRDISPAGNTGGGLGWLPDSRRLWFLAEHTGWMQLFTVDASTASVSRVAITEGTFEIDSVEVSADGSAFYIQSTEEHPGERQIYRVAASGGGRERLTASAGAHQGAVSPDGQTLGLISSAANRPPEVFVMPNRPGAAASQITTSTSEEWQRHRWVEPEVVTYKARDGALVYARLYTPEMVGAKRHPGQPAVIFVHGAGYLQNAHCYWSSYYREFMFHHLLASRGYVVLDPDYRASAGYGRDWRTAIYGWMGGHDLNDVVDGAKYLASSHRVNPARVGVYGGSYGRKSSPIYFAEGLKGALLICHGMVDVNVHFQDSVRLAQRLIELGKENWELAMYPVEDHGFVEATSWADEYKRILKLFEANLKR